jgi:hypothetical protein
LWVYFSESDLDTFERTSSLNDIFSTLTERIVAAHDRNSQFDREYGRTISVQRAYDDYRAAFDYYDRARTQHIATAISTKSSAASIIPNDHDRICHCNTCGVDR